MEALITGEIEHTIDSGNRLFVSRKLRNQMGGDEIGMAAYLAPGPNGVLSLYSEEAYRRYVYSLAAAETGNTVVYERMMFALATRIELDKGGRIQFTDKLRERYNLSDNLTLTGAGDHIEIWNKDDWEQYVKEQFAQFQNQLKVARSKAFDANRTQSGAAAVTTNSEG
jgi:MraZ protein